MPKAVLLEDFTKGIKPDFANSIFEVYGEETPMYTRINKAGRQSNIVTQTPVDMPGSAPVGGVADGTEAPDATAQNAKYALIESLTEKWQLTVGLGDLAGEFADQAGITKDGVKPEASQMARQIIKSLRALNTTIDRELCSSRDQRDYVAETGCQFRGIGSWISSAAQAVRPVPADYRPGADQIFSGQFADFDLDALQDILSACFLKTGFSGHYLGLCGIEFKRKITNWSIGVAEDPTTVQTVRRFNEPVESNKITANVKLLELDAGDVELRLSRNLNYVDIENESGTTALSKRTCYLIPDGKVSDVGGFEMTVNRKPTVKDLAYRGGSIQKEITAIMGVRGNPTTCGKIAPAADVPEGG